MSQSIDAAIAAIAASHHGVFAGHHLDELRVTREFRRIRVQSGRWDALHESVFRIAGAPESWRGSLQAACWAGGERSVASHRSAAALLGLPSGREDMVEISCPRWRRARHDGLIVHETSLLEQVDTDMIDGIPCTTAERTIFDLARFSTPRTLDVIIDNALRRDLTTVADLVASSSRLATRGRPGARRFKAVIAERTPAIPVPESAPERLLAGYLVDRGLPAPVPQHIVRDAAGAFVARVDLAYPDHTIAIEYDSYQEHVGKVALVRDSARRNAITACGIKVLTATAADIQDRGERLAQVLRSVLARAA